MASRQHFKSQQAYITALAPGNALNAREMVGHLSLVLEFNQNPKSFETCAFSKGVKHGLRLRATLVDMKGQLNIRRWEETASASMGHVWFADCESLFSYLVSPNTRQIDNTR